jgi:multidrug efflux system outer membrane protein
MMRCYLFLLLLVLASCKVGPTYHPPCIEAPDQWKNPAVEGEVALCLDKWWELFQDETLNQLEEDTVHNNPDLETALWRIEEARAVAAHEKALLFPDIDIRPGFVNTGVLFKIFLPPGGGFPPSVAANDVFRIHQQLFAIPLQLNYNLDLFGVQQQKFESAWYTEQAKEEAYRSLLLALTTSIAEAYFNLRAIDASILLLEETIDLRAKDLALSENRFRMGLVSGLDVENYKQLLAQSKIDLVDNERLRSLQENQMAALAGVPASVFSLPRMPLTVSPPKIPASLPSTMLLRRPDLAEAERTMAAQHALVGSSYAALLPSFSLTSGIGYQSPVFRKFMEEASRYWTMGVQSDQTLFDGGKKFSNIDIAWARFFEASSNYKSIALRAFKEVEDSLVEIEAEDKQVKNYEYLLEAAQQASNMSKRRYESGLVNNFEYIVNERAVLQAKLRLQALIGLQYASTLKLIRSLGGL